MRATVPIGQREGEGPQGPPGAGLTVGAAGQAVGLGDARALFPPVLLAVGVGRRRRLQLGTGGPGSAPTGGAGAPRGGLARPIGWTETNKEHA